MASALTLEECINEWSGALSGDYEKSKEQKNQDNGNNPPCFVLPGKTQKVLHQFAKVFKKQHLLILSKAQY